MNNVFLTGEKIDLCIPEERDFEQWAGWFNSQKVTRYLEQGKYPNTPELQRNFYKKAVEEGRFLMLIKTKNEDLLGVISLSEINHEKSSCQIALVCPEQSREALLAPLEAMAICTQHAFERFGMSRVWAGQAYPGLSKWSQKLELIGYKADAVFQDCFRRGMTVSDSIIISISQDRFSSLTQRRCGNLWPGEEAAKKILNDLKSHKPLAKRVDESIKSLHKENDQLLAELENNIGK